VSVRGEQCLMRSLFGDPPVVEHGDEVGIPYGAEPMGDKQARATGPILPDAGVDLVLGLPMS